MTLPLTDTEDRIGIESIDALLADRTKLVREAAPLWAQYGPGDVWSHHRKAVLSTLAMEHRGRAQEANEKLTDGKADDLAHSDPRYTALIAEALTGRARLFLLQDGIDAINHRIMRGNVVASYAKAEVRL